MKTIRKTYPFLLVLYGILSVVVIGGYAHSSNSVKTKPPKKKAVKQDPLRESAIDSAAVYGEF